MSYVGSRFKGWQKQKKTNLTIQETVENALARLSSERISVTASGRTDAGVHARIQVAHADFPVKFCERMLQPMNPKSESATPGLVKAVEAMNAVLPQDIRIHKVETVSDDFHAIRGVKMKTYMYFINPNPVQNPMLTTFSWHLRYALDWDAMKKASAYMVGRHDFKSFCGKGSDVKTTVRTVHEARFGLVKFGGSNLIAFRITGSGFLKQMVRNVVGTLVYVGRKRMDANRIPALLNAESRQAGRAEAGVTAPPQGLWLWDIKY